jgi:DNA-binding NarL/FixJ family response regulator
MSSMTLPEGPRRRLLVVSDDVASSEALRASRAGSHLPGNSARAAVNAARETDPNAVLVDAAVHGGWQHVVHALDPLVPRRRVAVLAAYWSTDARRAAEQTGIGGILLKQIEGEALVTRLRELGDDAGAAPEASGPPTAGMTGGAR